MPTPAKSAARPRSRPVPAARRRNQDLGNRVLIQADPETRAALKRLCDAKARREGGNPDRLASAVVRDLIRAADAALATT